MNNLNKINLNTTDYKRPLPVAFKGQVLDQNDALLTPEGTVIYPPIENVNFLGNLVNGFQKLLDKVYDNSRSDLVLDNLDQSEVNSSLNLIA